MKIKNDVQNKKHFAKPYAETNPLFAEELSGGSVGTVYQVRLGFPGVLSGQLAGRGGVRFCWSFRFPRRTANWRWEGQVS